MDDYDDGPPAVTRFWATNILGVIIAAALCGSSGLAVALMLPERGPSLDELGWVHPEGELALPPEDKVNRIEVQFSDSQRFGIVIPRLRCLGNADKPRLLTRDERGITNNTCICIDGYEYLFGVELPGTCLHMPAPVPGRDPDRSWLSCMDFRTFGVRVTQTVEIVPGEWYGLYNTALVRYYLWNRDAKGHTVGMRFLLDSFIGRTDGVPFRIPPIGWKPARLVTTLAELAGNDIPECVLASETGLFADPNSTIAVLSLKIAGYEPPNKVVICRWPQNSEVRWDWKIEPLDKNPNAKDSCVAMYWPLVNLAPGEARCLAFAYGLDRISAIPGGAPQMQLAVQRRPVAGQPFRVTAYFQSTDPDQMATLTVPPLVKLLPGQNLKQPVPPYGPRGYSQVTWWLKGDHPGTYRLKVASPGIGAKEGWVEIGEPRVYD
jgi:hypothetical protein